MALLFFFFFYGQLGINGKVLVAGSYLISDNLVPAASKWSHQRTQLTSWWCLEEACLWKSKILDNRVVRGGKSLKIAWISRWEKKEGGEDSPGIRADITLQPAEVPTKPQIYSKGTAAHEKDPCWKRGELWRGRSSREPPLGADQFPIPLCCLQGGGREGTGLKSEVGHRVKRKKSVSLMIGFVPYYQNIL